MNQLFDLPLQKTDAGRAEIKSRALPLSRSVRNLLLMLDATRSAREWLSMVQGATEADANYLIAHGLIGVSPGAAAAPVAEPLPPTLSPLSYTELYSYLTRHAKQYLGLMKGYRLVLEVERCTDHAALRELASRFVMDVQQAQGEAVADQVRRALEIKS